MYEFLFPAITLFVARFLLHMFSVWQWDIIVVNAVWQTPGFVAVHQTGKYCDDPFQCFVWKTTIGRAYDTLLFLNHISVWLAFCAGMILLAGWFP